ncbi:ThiF family adenylyltransferase [Undibacterium parvum]|uniref:ThiF family adenylyltransferase n=1 Tax=Undibacterium parvum TaxID=401471 RepID=A0A3S9HGB9_9BURK|nr:ThiF family adenylyltransferase [Undibacterium parvum]AZP11143.1 ThiF family adenylyltransferase [Undibacterium parvum]
MDAKFNYAEAFARNLGWVTAAEQQQLRQKRIAIAGMGAVGSAHLITLVRLGIEKFHIADMDTYGLVNFNRQIGANMATIDQPKVEVMAAMARSINPNVELKIFPAGVSKENLSEFLAGVDLYVDGLDFFAFSARQATFAACAAKGIPATTVAPLGMGAALFNFLPGGMTFEEYFLWGDNTDEEKALRFLVGLAPAGLHGAYLVDPSSINFAERRGPSTMMACQLCAGVAGSEALKILLGRGNVIAAPRGVHFDAYRNKLVHTWRPGGNNNLLQRIALSITRKRFMKPSA